MLSLVSALVYYERASRPERGLRERGRDGVVAHLLRKKQNEKGKLEEKHEQTEIRDIQPSTESSYVRTYTCR